METDSSKMESPLIEELKWGYMKVKGFLAGKDFKLFPGGAEEWDWNKSNTHHVPGIQVADVEYLLDKQAKYIVLSKGMQNQLQTAEETVKFLEESASKLGVVYFIETTTRAHELYNELVNEKKLVGALIHSTC